MDKIIMDSAGDLKELADVDFSCVPLKILAGNREFVDNESVDIASMVEYLKGYKGKSSTSCPAVGDYLEAFGEADNVYCVTITSGLSGSYNSASIAAETYRDMHPDRNIHVIDSLSAGPHMTLIAEKLRDLVKEKLPFDTIVSKITEYQKKTKLIFSLESLHNLANNGRVPGAVAKLIGMLGMRLIGKASDEGRLQPTGKARGEEKVVPELLKTLITTGYQGGKLKIAHCFNESAAKKLCDAVISKFPKANVSISTTGALCSFYAEPGGMLIGFEV